MAPASDFIRSFTGSSLSTDTFTIVHFCSLSSTGLRATA